MAATPTQRAVRLPVKDEHGCFNIRLESIGGYGANIAGKMLAEAGVLYQGLNGSNFSSYGSEKKGSPVKAFIRFAEPDTPIRISSPIEEPHIVCIFHEALIRTQPVVDGLLPGGVVIVNTRKTPAEIQKMLGLEDVTIGTFDAMTIAVETGSRVNMAVLGAIARVAEFLDPDAIKAMITDTFTKKYPKTVPGNLRCFDRGYEEIQLEYFGASGDNKAEGRKRTAAAYGYQNMPIGGVIVNPGNMASKDLSASRQGFLPSFNRETCIDCAQCDMVCPDYCFVWEQGVDKRGRPAMVLKGIDYQYCKGCLKCVEACPTDALQDLREEDGYAAAHTVRHTKLFGLGR
ncbi:pyruvate ferredoxin oxidoreductase gamma subunit [Symbiobacterium terraclitae]|uniref:Pyruvate ferredoxin oxidoreductase gamma subunit n=1 Tax=Symbiobacterium terraclitae TaxID=557451 RepID=A0ABS4JV06_9FIRM|nr:2-oxoacid:acceptor oxidoreductase family protein [Symbiobacterium terraclitae]MBP2019394.1 pyruvate ferredoxin oxidoreductase gamma subunit [Symbiobacterium terraclitae]